jgi:hypothetical protein
VLVIINARMFMEKIVFWGLHIVDILKKNVIPNAIRIQHVKHVMELGFGVDCAVFHVISVSQTWRMKSSPAPPANQPPVRRAGERGRYVLGVMLQ